MSFKDQLEFDSNKKEWILVQVRRVGNCIGRISNEEWMKNNLSRKHLRSEYPKVKADGMIEKGLYETGSA